MRDKQPPDTNLPSIEETNQSRTVKMPLEANQNGEPKPGQLGAAGQVEKSGSRSSGGE